MGIFEKFAEHFDFIYQTFVNYENECDAIEKIFNNVSSKKPKNILDVGCGTGSHAVILAKRGYDVVGIDISRQMIKKAEEKAKKKKVKAQFFVQDMRNIKLDRRFDCAICMFGGFGYMLTFDDLTKLFSGLKQCLKKESLFIFHFWSVGGVKPSPYRSWIKAEQKGMSVYRFSESNFDTQTDIITLDMNFLVIKKNRPFDNFSERHVLRCYTLAELREYLLNNGFKLFSAYDWDTENKIELKNPKRETFGVLAIAKKS